MRSQRIWYAQRTAPDNTIILALDVTQTYGYDAFNRLSSASEGANWAQTNVYDSHGLGNRAVWSGQGQFIPSGTATPQVTAIDPTLVDAQFPNKNQWANAGYDASGNVITLASKSFTYDAENRMVTATVSNMPAISYAYDGEGRRVRKSVGSASVTYVHDALGQLAAEYCTDDSPHTYCNASVDAGTTYLVVDHLGSTRLVTGTSTANPVRTRYDYLPFGEEIPAGMAGRPTATRTQPAEYSAGASPVNPPYRQDVDFTGKERDAETGLDFFGARYMSAAQGRFTSPDPVLLSKQKLVDPQQWNLYGYVRNNPLRLLDPDGREVRVLDEAALKAIQSTVSASLRSSIKLDKKGFIDKKVLNKIKTADENFNDLKAAVNLSSTMEVSTAKQFGGREFEFKSKEDVQKERDQEPPGTVVLGREAPMDMYYVGHTASREETVSGNVEVVLSDWTGKAATAPEAFRADTAAHEIYGHGLPNMKGLPWKHDDRGPVDANIERIRERTYKLYDKKP